MIDKTFNKDDLILINNIIYRIIKLIGHGKGGYSYLATNEKSEVVIKKIHHEPCSYYNFGDKIQSELNDYQTLLNLGIRIPKMIAYDIEQEIIVKEYINSKYRPAREITDYQEMVDAVDARHKTMSRFIRDKVIVKDIQEQSNGESALMYFSTYIADNGLYVLDEPENSMSASMQIKLAKFIEDSARFFNCQFIIATHSPFILGIKDATIYDLDSIPSVTKNFAELENMQVYYEFFKLHAQEFTKNN